MANRELPGAVQGALSVVARMSVGGRKVFCKAVALDYPGMADELINGITEARDAAKAEAEKKAAPPPDPTPVPAATEPVKADPKPRKKTLLNRAKKEKG